MSLRYVEEQLTCAFSNDKHTLNNPITLINCEHSVCKSCFPKTIINSNIKCTICKKETPIKDFNTHLKSIKIFEYIERDTVSKLVEWKNNLKEDRKEFIDIKVKNLKENIDIRVDSIKIDAEKAEEIMIDNLIKMKYQLINDVNIIKNEMFEENLKELQNNINSKKNLTEEFLEKMQNNLNNLKFTLKEFNSKAKFPEIEISKIDVNEDLIGKIYFDVKSKTEINFKDLYMNGSRRFYNQIFSVSRIDVIDDQIICANLSRKCLFIYDKDLNYVKKIDRISGLLFKPRAIRINLKDKFIYIFDENCMIWMTDLNYKFIKSVGSRGTEDNQFLRPKDICYTNECLYAIDSKKRIQIYTKNLLFLKSIKTNYVPFEIRGTNSRLLIRGTDHYNYFYNLDNFSLITKHYHENDDNSHISKFQSSFYVTIKGQVYCYDENGNLKDIFKRILQSGYFQNFVEFNGGILIMKEGIIAENGLMYPDLIYKIFF